MVKQQMSHANSSQFVQSLAEEFFRRYDCLVSQDKSDGELWIECRSAAPARFRSPLTFGITPDSVTVAFDGLTHPFVISQGVRDAETVRRQALGLFDDLITERQVSISFWRGDECIAVEFIRHEQIQARRGVWSGSSVSRVLVRSWLGRYDHDFAA